MVPRLAYVLEKRGTPKFMTCDTTIHIIDDDQAMLESLSLLLTTEGYSVRTYESTRRFLDAIKLIFYSSNLQHVDRTAKTVPENRLGTTIL